jgi:L-asparaginase II
MRAGRGDWVAKIGAEGVQGIGVRGAGLGIAVKISDGNKRALRPVVAAVLDALELLDARSRAELAAWFEPPLHNYRGIVTGRIVSSVVLDNVASS